jgi:alkylhydroperoxidase/carboxymuconolactone decarboxylase family protein YurZ
MDKTSIPPQTHEEFVQHFPKLGQAWELLSVAGAEGPLDAKTARLVKVAIAMGAMREGAVHAGVRKAMDIGVTKNELDQVVALAAGTLGLPATVALFTWIRDETD